MNSLSLPTGKLKIMKSCIVTVRSGTHFRIYLHISLRTGYRPTGLLPFRTCALHQWQGGLAVARRPKTRRAPDFGAGAGDQQNVALLDTGAVHSPFSRLQPSFLISSAAFEGASKERQDDGGQESAPLLLFSLDLSLPVTSLLLELILCYTH